MLTAAGLRGGDGAGVARHKNDGGCCGEIEVESVQCVLRCCFCGSPPCAMCAGREGGRGGEGDRERRVKARRTGFMKMRDLRERERERDLPCEVEDEEEDA